MKIAILGGGFTGMTAAYELAKKGNSVTLFEKENVLGGLAVGFKQKNWNWYLERAYHHLFANDSDILNFAKDIGFEKIIFRSPETSSLYEIEKMDPVSNSLPPVLGMKEKISVLNDLRGAQRSEHAHRVKNTVSSFHSSALSGSLSSRHPFFRNNYRIFPLDSPQDLLQLPLLSLPEKLRSGMVLAFLKFSPFLSMYEKHTAQEFLKKYIGERAWNVLWQQLFRKKFGRYAENILASFMWARISKRTKDLGYIQGGFQTLINYLEKELLSERVNVLIGYEVEQIEKREEVFEISYSDSGLQTTFVARMTGKPTRHSGERSDSRIKKESFDLIISTLPTAIMGRITQDLFPANYLSRFKKLKYLHAVNLILETKQPLLDKVYWLNVCAKELPLMAVVQHTNFMDKKNYGGNNILYVGWYVEGDDKLLKMNDKEVLDFCLPALKKISSRFNRDQISNYFLFKGPFAQPIFDHDFVANKPDFITPVKNFFIANLDMTYPYDRGTNYAVKLGKDVSKFI